MTPTSKAKERILLFGREGTGKTYAWCTIANWLRRTDTPGHFYAIDTDMAVGRMADAWPDFESNVTWGDAADWPDYGKLLDSYIASGTEHDWLVVDLIDKAWDAVQNYFIEQVHGKAADEWFLEFRSAGKSGHPLAGEFGINWSVINKLYSAWIGRVLRFPGHVLCCAPADTLQGVTGQGAGRSDPEAIEIFGRLGVKPKGQKSLGHQFHTILLMTTKRDGWACTTAKDRSRERLTNSPMSDFVLNYLVPVGGWQT